MIDSHCHLNASYPSETAVSSIIESFQSKGGKRIVDVATNIEEIAISQSLARAYPTTIYCNVGLHPETPNGQEASWNNIQDSFRTLTLMINTPTNLVGIGETGLDYSFKETHGEYFTKVIEQQRELFVSHIELAKNNTLPLVIHARGVNQQDYSVYQDVLDILTAEKFSGKVYFHSFGGTKELAEKIMDQGYFIGVNGIVTYSGAQVVAECIQYAPLSAMLLETDAPFLIPSNLDRKELQNPKTNEPIGIFATALRLAKLKKTDMTEVLHACEQNAHAIFERML